ncbi:OprD family porin [Pseudomonas sp. YeP6b]|uniref:OprD family porin n=1 Tax=Pseudomonas sp. YeP6b TaxID=2861775 RepID=UPI0021D7FD74|nr:OprD family porin [Pseudomonas sp. YeP6b]UXZ21938.1 OprD family porin [Pseudomonas sp. YeP6b]
MSTIPLTQAASMNLITKVCALNLSLFLTPYALADFISDSTGKLELKNFYYNRDYRDPEATQSKREEWAQGFALQLESGFTEGTVGVGVDVLGMAGFKLDSSASRTRSGLLPVRDSGKAEDSYGEVGVTAKLRASHSTLKIGTLVMPPLPFLEKNIGSLHPQLFRGAYLHSQEVQDLKLDLGRITQVNQPNSTNYEALGVGTGTRKNIVVRGKNQSDAFDFAGGSYAFNKQITGSYYYSALDNLYTQHAAALQHTYPVAENQSLKSELRYARSTDNGNTNIDNTALGAQLSYSLGSHKWTGAYQTMQDNTGFAALRGSFSSLVNFFQYSDFANKDEKSWQLRYDYDFASLGVPGLSLFTRYASGSNVDLGPGRSDGREWERDIDVTYVFQNPTLKNVKVRVRNAMVRSNFERDIDETRLIVSYERPLW